MNISSKYAAQINYYGTWTLIKKEVWRFVKVYHQTLFSPVVNVLLLLAIFSLAMNHHSGESSNGDFRQFVAAGLIMMAAMQNAFANSSSSFVMAKVLGHIVDLLMPPLSAGEMLFAFTVGAVLRGFMVGIIALLAIAIFVPITFHHPFYAFFTMLMATIFLSLLGILCGIISDSFDQMSAVTSYLITPLTFLSGTFYSVNALPEFWHKIALSNPFFHMIDGFRYGIIGHHDGNLLFGSLSMIGCNLVLAIVIYLMLKKGYRIKN